MPDREQPTIENLAREAVATHAAKTFALKGRTTPSFFVAVPIHEQSTVTGRLKL